MAIGEVTPTALTTVAPAAAEIGEILDSPEVAALIAELEDKRWTGRVGYGSRALVGACLVKSLYAIPTWTRTAALIADHSALQAVLGGAPSQWACYRFTEKLREQRPLLDSCLNRVLLGLRMRNPEMGRDIAIDGSDMPGYGNGQRFLSKGGKERERFSDPDASWGHRSAVSTRKGGGYYGFKIHAAVCAVTGLPLAWEVQTAKTHDSTQAHSLMEACRRRDFAVKTCSMDKGYDSGAVYEACEDNGTLPIIPLRQTPNVVREPDTAPRCEHGRWQFAGADFKRKATKWRCPTGECQPKSTWVKADRRNPLVPRETRRWKDLYRGRASVEREFGRLKNEYGLAPLRVRGIERVALHADLVMLARLSKSLARARTIPLAA